MFDYNIKVDEIIKKEETQVKPTLSEKAADVVSQFGGSWTFVIFFMLFFIGWISFNVYVFAYDNYPFILLNLILSCIAVFQAPFILMSQNRLAQIDRKRAENDYRVDLHNELEIIQIHKMLNIIMKKLDEK